MTLHIFNPENDMAQADGKPGYTPPAIIQQMRRELYGLPYWWAEEEDVVWDGTSPLHLQEGDTIRPWGWSPALKHQLQLAGVGESFLPSDQQLAELRRISHRGTAVEALHDITADIPNLVGESRLCRSWEEVQETLNDWQRVLLKAPWSSSGKGLMMADHPQAKAWAERIIRQQGSVVAERWLDRVVDLALEFWVEAGDVRYEGLSLFTTDEKGAYRNGLVLPEGEKMAMLAQMVDPRTMGAVQQWWMERLRTMHYTGPVGIDMLLTRDGRLCPCVEINWRMTMGLVSVWAARQGRRGTLLVEYTYGHFSAEIE